jgi:hypothetical protein
MSEVPRDLVHRSEHRDFTWYATEARRSETERVSSAARDPSLRPHCPGLFLDPCSCQHECSVPLGPSSTPTRMAPAKPRKAFARVTVLCTGVTVTESGPGPASGSELEPGLLSVS